MTQTTPPTPAAPATKNRKALATAIWRATHKDYRTTRGSECHPGVMLVDAYGATVLVSLLSVDSKTLADIAAKRVKAPEGSR